MVDKPKDTTPATTDTKVGDMKWSEVREKAAKHELFTHIDANKTATFKLSEKGADVVMTHSALKNKITELTDQIAGKAVEGKTAIKPLEGEALKTAEAELKIYKDEATKLIKGISESRYKQFGELGIGQKLNARVAGNFGKASTTVKVIRGGSIALGALLVGKGFKDLIAPERDDKGENVTGLVVPFGELAAGGLAVYLAALHGGADRAMGLGKA